jgi:hypothetical protein
MYHRPRRESSIPVIAGRAGSAGAADPASSAPASGRVRAIRAPPRVCVPARLGTNETTIRRGRRAGCVPASARSPPAEPRTLDSTPSPSAGVARQPSRQRACRRQSRERRALRAARPRRARVTARRSRGLQDRRRRMLRPADMGARADGSRRAAWPASGGSTPGPHPSPSLFGRTVHTSSPPRRPLPHIHGFHPWAPTSGFVIDLAPPSARRTT